MAAAIQTTDERIEVFMRKPETIEKFTSILGRSAMAFISSALILINSDEKLQECTTVSLYKSILRSASLELSLDQSIRQGWLIARKRKIKAYTKTDGTKVPEHWVQEATFQPHYNGLRALAERTGKYKVINVSPIYAGQVVRLDQLTGLHYIVLGNTFTMPEQSNRLTVANTLDVTNGKPQEKVVGYLGYYKTQKGVERTVYMSISEIHQHARTWALDAYNNEYGAWKDPKKLPVMEMKTVFLQLTKTMDLSGKENENLRTALEIEDSIEQDEPLDGLVIPDSDPEAEQHKRTTEELLKELKS